MKLFFTTALALVAANAPATAAANDDVALPQHTIGLGLAADLVYVTADKVDADVDASSRQTDVNANQAYVVDKVSAHCFSERVAVHTDGDGIIVITPHMPFVYILCFSSPQIENKINAPKYLRGVRLEEVCDNLGQDLLGYCSLDDLVATGICEVNYTEEYTSGKCQNGNLLCCKS